MQLPVALAQIKVTIEDFIEEVKKGLIRQCSH